MCNPVNPPKTSFEETFCAERLQDVHPIKTKTPNALKGPWNKAAMNCLKELENYKRSYTNLSLPQRTLICEGVMNESMQTHNRHGSAPRGTTSTKQRVQSMAAHLTAVQLAHIPRGESPESLRCLLAQA